MSDTVIQRNHQQLLQQLHLQLPWELTPTAALLQRGEQRIARQARATKLSRLSQEPRTKSRGLKSTDLPRFS